MAENPKPGEFGDWSKFRIRQVGNLVVDRDTATYFDTSGIEWRGVWRPKTEPPAEAG